MEDYAKNGAGTIHLDLYTAMSQCVMGRKLRIYRDVESYLKCQDSGLTPRRYKQWKTEIVFGNYA